MKTKHKLFSIEELAFGNSFQFHARNVKCSIKQKNARGIEKLKNFVL